MIFETKVGYHYVTYKTGGPAPLWWHTVPVFTSLAEKRPTRKAPRDRELSIASLATIVKRNNGFLCHLCNWLGDGQDPSLLITKSTSLVRKLVTNMRRAINWFDCQFVESSDIT